MTSANDRERREQESAEWDAASNPKIYFWPNLMTAGNLFCGFVALTKIVEADLASASFVRVIQQALGFILLACIFDLLDGRVARMGGRESPFGREFDSLADLVSFGVAPAFLVHRIVLKDFFAFKPEIGWFIASIYLICGALRLARFNCISAAAPEAASKEFMGFPIPAAAALVASLTMFILWNETNPRFDMGHWRYVLPSLLIFLSVMMISKVRYPSFKNLDLRTRRTFTKTVASTLFVGLVLILWDIFLPVVLPLLFTTYLVYGFIRPHISRRMRREIEDYDEEEEEDDSPSI